MKIKLTPQFDSDNSDPEEIEFELNRDQIEFEVVCYGENYTQIKRRLTFSLADFEILVEAAGKNNDNLSKR